MNKILVIIPIYNREKYLKKAIDSVLNQTHKNFELVLVDDASTDKSLEICKQYENLDNVTILSNPKNMGCYYARNHALCHFKNMDWDFFTIHDSDDTSDPERFNKIIQPFSNTHLLGMKTTFTKVDQSGVPQLRVGTNEIEITASEGIAIFARRTFKTLGYFDDTRFSGDTDYWWRLQNFCTLNSPYIFAEHMLQLYYALSHEENLTKIYNFHTDRPKYFQKSMSEIRSKMIPSNNFYRNFIASV